METMTKEERSALTKATMALLDDWGLRAAEIINVLGLPTNTRFRQLEHYRRDKSFPFDEHIMLRIEHLIGIADALRTTYPLNSRIGVIWLRKPHRRLAHRTPLATIVEDGMDGLRSVRAELDCSYSWECSTI
jgi:hypothetical protein